MRAWLLVLSVGLVSLPAADAKPKASKPVAAKPAPAKPAAKPPASSATPRWQQLPLPPAMPRPVTSGHVVVGKARIYYATYGKGAPVVLLHGGLGNSDHFAFQLPALVDKFQVIVVDSRGQGRSSLPKGKLSYHAMAGDVVAVLDHLGVAKASFVGWSDGGAIALDLAVTAPSRVVRGFILGTNYDGKGSKPRKGKSHPTFTRYAAKCRADHRRLGNKPKSFDDAIDALLPVWRNPGGFTKDQLRGIQAPMMIALGDHDEIIELAQVKEMATELIPHGELRVFADTSHFALWQDPASVNAALVAFLTAK